MVLSGSNTHVGVAAYSATSWHYYKTLKPYALVQSNLCHQKVTYAQDYLLGQSLRVF